VSESSGFDFGSKRLIRLLRFWKQANESIVLTLQSIVDAERGSDYNIEIYRERRLDYFRTKFSNSNSAAGRRSVPTCAKSSRRKRWPSDFGGEHVAKVSYYAVLCSCRNSVTKLRIWTASGKWELTYSRVLICFRNGCCLCIRKFLLSSIRSRSQFYQVSCWRCPKSTIISMMPRQGVFLFCKLARVPYQLAMLLPGLSRERLSGASSIYEMERIRMNRQRHS
jgi:hypothetical protein